MQNLFFKKYLFEYENHFAVEKKNTKNFWGHFQKYFLSPSKKNASHTISICINCMTSVFFQKTKIKKVKVFSRSSPKNA